MLHIQFARFGQPDHPEPSAGTFGQKLPWDDIRMVFEGTDDNLIAGADESLAERRGHQIDCLCGAARKEHFFGVFRSDVAGYPLASIFVLLRSHLTQMVYAAVDIGIECAVGSFDLV